MLNPKSLITFLWIVAFVCINPIGEFPINDDWAYAKNVYNLVENGRFVVDYWPAMNLVSQTIYGSGFAFIFGFSFTILRISILLLAITSSLIFYNIVKKLSDENEWIAFYITVTFCFNIIFCSLSFTFMTDIFFLSFIIFAIDQLLKYRDTKKYPNYLLCILFCAIAVLNRQHGLLLPIIIIGFVYIVEKSFVKKTIMIALPIAVCWLAHDKYRHYLTEYGISHNIQSLGKLFIYLKTAPFSDHLLHAGDMLLVTGWVLIPLNILLISQFKDYKIKAGLKLLIIAGFVLLATFNALPHHPLGNTSNILEIGPRAVKQNPVPHFPYYMVWIKIAVTTISFISVCITMFFLTRKDLIKNTTASKSFFRLPLFLFILLYFIFVSINKAYFDRYALPLILLVVLLLIPKLNATQLKLKSTLIIVMATVYIVTILENKDFFNWQKNRWKALTYLQNKGISPHEIDGGFEYNGWHKTNKDYPNDSRSWWWVDKDNYVVTNEKLNNFELDTLFTFKRFLPYKSDTVYVLKRITNR
ncbi:MAG: glycosyltransferase family 39 protein [Bacteroidales bacterium]|nr:glycosyltransferase family 39 protein [Bacteroidales bacterium]